MIRLSVARDRPNVFICANNGHSCLNYVKMDTQHFVNKLCLLIKRDCFLSLHLHCKFFFESLNLQYFTKVQYNSGCG